MTKYIKYHKEYTKFGEAYQLVLPLNLEGLVPNESSLFMKKQKSKSGYESEVTAPLHLSRFVAAVDHSVLHWRHPIFFLKNSKEVFLTFPANLFQDFIDP